MMILIIMTGLMAGIYFAFSTFVMKALHELPPLHAGQAMNKINDVIVNTVFLPIFFGSTLWYGGLIVWSFADWQGERSILRIAASLFYIVGMFGVSVLGNVPLNNKLKASSKNDASLIEVWANYLGPWRRLNHLRTISCILSSGLLTLSLT